MKNLLIMFLLLFGFILNAEKVSSLSVLEKPTDIVFFSGNTYIMDGASVLTYETKTGKFRFKFARKGEGPGEIKVSPFNTLTLSIHKDNIAIDSLDKIIYYSPEGKFVNEIKKGRFLALQLKPVSDNFVVKGVDRKDRKTEYITLSIYDKNMQKVKEIARQRSNIQLGSVEMIPDSLHFTIIKDNVYVEKSYKGFLIGVFNKNGDLIKEIKGDHQNIKVKQIDRDNALNRYKNDSLVKQFGFEQLKSRNKFLYKKIFPEIQNILNYDNNLVIKTFKKDGDNIQYMIFNKEGKLTKKIFLPRTWKGEMIAHLNGVEPKLYKFHKGYFYYLVEKY